VGGKSILIIFPYPHLAYSPTTINLCKLLKGRGNKVTVVYGFEKFWREQATRLDGITLKDISYSKRTIRVAKHVNKLVWKPIAKVLQRLSILPVYNQLSLRELLFSRIIKKALRTKFDDLIAVDSLPLYWAQQAQRDCHFVSLEVDDGLQLIGSLDTTRIKSVLIQSEERFQRLFGNAELRRFFVQNAPNFIEPTTRTRASTSLIYNGTAWTPFGSLDIIEFVKRYPEYRVHFKGNVHEHLWALVQSRYKDLIDSGTLSFSEMYLDDSDLRAYLADYSIGFCFYDFNHPAIAQRRFNYETAPSGKVFLYLSVGMPVVATRIRGFRFIEERQAGVLLDDHRPETIKKAVDTILSDYNNYSNNALATGRMFSFDESAKPFVDFISQ